MNSDAKNRWVILITTVSSTLWSTASVLLYESDSSKRSPNFTVPAEPRFILLKTPVVASYDLYWIISSPLGDLRRSRPSLGNLLKIGTSFLSTALLWFTSLDRVISTSAALTSEASTVSKIIPSL